MPAAAACPQAVRDGDILRMWNEDVEGLQTCFAGLFDDFSPLRPDL
jgi:Zn ribbon nucleic-acid-binding protein